MGVLADAVSAVRWLGPFPRSGSSFWGKAGGGEAGEKHKRVVVDGTTDSRSPIFAGPQVSCIAPHRYPGCLEYGLQPVDLT